MASSTTIGQLFVLELSEDRCCRWIPTAANRKIIATGCRYPDGVVGRCRKPVTSTGPTMGVPNLNDGSIERADIATGGNRQTHHPSRRHLQAKAASPRKGERQAVPGRTERGCASCAPISTVRTSKPCDRDRPRRRRPPRPSPSGRVGINCRLRCAGEFYWSQKGPDNARAGPHLPRPVSTLPSGRDRSQSQRYRNCCSTGYRSRSTSNSISKPSSVLDRSGRSAARQPPSAAHRSDALPRPGQLPEIVLTHMMGASASRLDVPNDRMFMTICRVDLPRPGSMGRRSGCCLQAQGNSSPALPMPKLPAMRADMSFNKPVRRVAIVGNGVNRRQLGCAISEPAGSMSSPPIPHPTQKPPAQYVRRRLAGAYHDRPDRLTPRASG